MLDKYEINLENDEYIQKALTCGVKIRNHGECARFKRKVDGFKDILENYNKEKEEEQLATQTCLNIKTDNRDSGDMSPAPKALMQ